MDASDLPSAKAQTKIPGANGEEAPPDAAKAMEGVTPTSSIPTLRPPLKDPKKKEDDPNWVTTGVKQQQEEAKKKQEEETAAEEKKILEEKAKSDLESKKDKKEKDSSEPSLAKSAVSGFNEKKIDKDPSQLPAVTGLDGVKPRAMASGDGRVQPGFDSFSGPSASGPLGKDYQSGAKPIMPPNGSMDGRMAVDPSKVPEPPSGAYKRISQDPNTMPAGYGEKKVVPTPKPVVIAKNPPPGNPLTPGKPAGQSPYDSARTVSDPRSTRRF